MAETKPKETEGITRTGKDGETVSISIDFQKNPGLKNSIERILNKQGFMAWYPASKLYSLDEMLEHLKFAAPITDTLKIFYFTVEEAYFSFLSLNLDSKDMEILEKATFFNMMKSVGVNEGEKTAKELYNHLKQGIFTREPEIKLSVFSEKNGSSFESYNDFAEQSVIKYYKGFSDQYFLLFNYLKKYLKGNKNSKFYWTAIDATKKVLKDYKCLMGLEGSFAAAAMPYLLEENPVKRFKTELNLSSDSSLLLQGHLSRLDKNQEITTKSDQNLSKFYRQDYYIYRKKIEIASNYVIAILANAISLGNRYDCMVCLPEMQEGIVELTQVIQGNPGLKNNIEKILGREFPYLQQLVYQKEK